MEKSSSGWLSWNQYITVKTDPLCWFEELPRFSKIHYNLYRARLLLTRFVPGHEKLKVFFITGSKGKGTVATTLASILRQAGLPTGLITSPHMFRVTERINFQGVDIAEDQLRAYLGVIRKDLPSLEERYGTWVFGEIVLVAALMWFRDFGAEAVVIEAGLGGRLDPGNIFLRPQATCITNVTLEHQGVLGGTIAEIAGEKGGIIKPCTPIVTGAESIALDVLKQRSRLLSAPLYSYPGDIFWTKVGGRKILRLPTLTLPIELDFHTVADQVNVALAACLASFHPGVGVQAIQQGLRSRPHLPGRFEIAGSDPICIIDVAHTPESLANLLKAVKTHYPGLKLAIVTSIMPDKKIRRMLEMMLAFTPHVFLAPVSENQPPYETLGAVPVDSIGIGITRACNIAEVVCITGSFSAARQAKEYLAMTT